MLFQILGLWLHLKEIFFLGLTVTEINIKEVQDKRKNGRQKWHFCYRTPFRI